MRFLLQQLRQRAARLVAADHREQPRARAERRAVPGDVGRAAQPFLFVFLTSTTGTGASGEMRDTSPNQ